MLRISCTLCSFLLVCGLANAQNKKNGGNVQQATPQDYAFLLQAGQVIGALSEVDPNGTMTLRIECQYPVLEKNKGPAPRPQNKNLKRNKRNNGNRNQGNSLQQLMRQGQEVMKIDNPAERQRRWQQLMLQIQRVQAQEMQRDLLQMQQKVRQMQANAPDLKLAKAVKEITLPVSSNVRVRRWDLPVVYDNKGNLKEYTKEEIARLRGKDTNLPGYEAAYTDLQPGQVVRLTLTPPQANLGVLTRPQISLALILVEGGAIPVAAKKKRN